MPHPYWIVLGIQLTILAIAAGEMHQDYPFRGPVPEGDGPQRGTAPMHFIEEEKLKKNEEKIHGAL